LCGQKSLTAQLESILQISFGRNFKLVPNNCKIIPETFFPSYETFRRTTLFVKSTPRAAIPAGVGSQEDLAAGLPDFSCYSIPKREKYTKLP
jgi:hypothetical protein